jgi:MFS family permease
MAPTELRGRYMGVWTLVYLGGYGLGPLCGGFAMDALGARSAFVVVAAAGLLGAALFPLMRRRRRPDVTV